MVERMTLLKGAAVVLGLLVVAGGGLGVYALSGGFEQPTVESIDVRWGEVTEETSTIRATIVVNNPNPIGVPGIISVGYTASLNDVAIAEGTKSGVGLSTGTNELELAIPVDNSQIPAWWVTHVNNDEQSTLAIDATVKGPLGLSFALPSQQQSFETDMLGALASDETSEISLFGQPIIVVGERQASWGEATAETTPLTVSAQVTNQHDEPISFDGVGYVVTMNGITMAEGEDQTEFTVAPGETETLEIQADLETPAIQDWWVSHLQNDEQTTLSVETYAIVDGGEDDPTVELDLITLGLDLETDLLGGGGASTSNVTRSVGGDLAFETPEVSLGGLSWGDVTDATTELDATLEISNPNADSPLNDLLDLSFSQQTQINGVQVADDTTTVEDLPTGTETVTLTANLDNSKVPEWWARHVNNDESSTVSVNSSVTVDVGVTAFELPVAAIERPFTTDLLSGMNRDLNQQIQFLGRNAMTLESTSAAWGQADAQETPIEAGATVTNELREPLTVSDVQYTITMNEVVVGEGTDSSSVTIQPDATETLSFTMVLDSPKMADWWVTHVQNGEETTITMEVSVQLEAGGLTKRVTFDLLGGGQTIETNILGGS